MQARILGRWRTHIGRDVRHTFLEGERCAERAEERRISCL
jgi:hypothetical protein